MFIAKDKTGKVISIFNQTMPSLAKLKNKAPFYCPSCNEEMILKIGKKNLPHFAHKSKCPVKPEGESELHMKGKLKLFSWLKQQGFQPRVEEYLPGIKQQPDLLFYLDAKPIVVEFQCSIITSTEIRKRTENFLKNGYQPIWIIYENSITQRYNTLIHLTDFLSYFLTKGHHSPLILSFNPETEEFVTYSNIIPYSINRALATKKRFSLQNSFMTLFKYKFKEGDVSFEQWIILSEKWLAQLSTRPYARKNRFLMYLYQNYLHPLLLPPEIGIPLPNMYFIENSPFEWQFYLWFHLIYKKERGSTFKRSQIALFVLRDLNRFISFRNLPLFSQRDHFKPIHGYIQFLVNIGLLDAHGDTLIVKEKPNLLPNTNIDRKKERVAFLKRHKKFILRFFS